MILPNRDQLLLQFSELSTPSPRLVELLILSVAESARVDELAIFSGGESQTSAKAGRFLLEGAKEPRPRPRRPRQRGHRAPCLLPLRRRSALRHEARPAIEAFVARIDRVRAATMCASVLGEMHGAK